MIPKYRAWDTVKKAMSEVQAVVYTEERVYPIYSKVIRRYIPFSEAVLMQSTGLKDKNGKEVYIGDIVKCTRGCPHEVIFLKEYGGNFIGGMPAIYLSDILEGYAWTEEEEIIGNIWENPELLEEVE